MAERDVRIGRNLAWLRGGWSQQWVADLMRERGHKWSQATVWAVEKGDRPLRLAEAEDLAAILSAEDVTALLQRGGATREWRDVLQDIEKAKRDREELGTDALARLAHLHQMLRALDDQNGQEDVDLEVVSEARRLLQAGPWDLLDDRREVAARAERVKAPVAGMGFVRLSDLLAELEAFRAAEKERNDG